jgi:hypothetical protein
MADEAIPMIHPTRFGRVTIAAGAVIPKYSLIAITDPNTGAVVTADNDVFGGIAMEASTALDTMTEIGVALDGTWALKATAAGITIGNDVTIGGANTVKIYTTLDDEKGYVVGKALETTAGSETIMVRLNL